MTDIMHASEEECRAFIVGQLARGDLPAEIADKLAARVAPACKQSSQSALGLKFRVGRWVIRQEDLAFFGVLRTCALTAVAVAADVALAAPVVSGLTAAAETGWNMWRKGARLEPADLRVLVELERSADPLPAKEIAERLSSTTERWSVKQVERILRRLSELPVKGGKIAVVQKTPKGGWRSVH